MTKPSIPSIPPSPAPLPGSDRARSVEPYESRLGRDLTWAMREGGAFLREESELQKSLRKIADRLRSLGIDYAVVGGIAMFRHGYRRFTEDVDVLVTRDGLKTIHERLEGLGYVPPFAGSKNLRDAENGVRIEFLVAGEYPGDGKPKPVAFPDPAGVAEESDGIRYITLAKLIELKLASGISNAERMKDLADVLELIKARSLSSAYGEALDPFVQSTYRRLWSDANPGSKRYLLRWPIENAAEVRSFEDLMERVPAASDSLRSMQADGVELAARASVDFVVLSTNDPAVARKHDMHAEDEFLSPHSSPKD
jgi:hypothetical protein